MQLPIAKLALNKKVYWGVAAVAILAVGGYAFASRGGPKVGKYEWEFATVEKGDVAKIVSASGTVQPLNVTDVGSQVSGKIIELLADYNTVVKKDQVLARIDPETFISAVNSAKAQVLQSQASVENARASVQRSQVNLDNTRRVYERNKVLFGQQAISAAAWEQSERDLKVAEVQLRTDEVSVRSSEAGLANSRARLQDSETNLARTYIRSPIDGVVINRAVNVGQTVQSSMQVANLFKIAADLSQIQIEASVVESDIGGITEGDPVSFTVDAQQGRRFQGMVSQVRKLGTEQANVVTYTVVIRAQNPQNVLLPGMTANVDITADRASDVLRIANDATRFQPPKDIQDALNAKAQAERGQNGQGGPNGQGGNRGPGGGQQGGGGPQTASFGGGGPGGPGGGGNRGGGMGGRGGGMGMPTEMFKEMGVPDDKVQVIQAAINAEREKMMASMPRPQQQGGNPMGGGGGFGPPQDMVMRQQMQERMQKMEASIEAIMRSNLTPEQYETYQARRTEMQNQKRATVYRVNDKGEVERHGVMIGISDGSYAQILRGAEAGEKFITRLKQPAPK